MENFSWVKIYKEIAHKILEYKDDSSKLAEIMYKSLEGAGLMRSEEKGSNLDFDGQNRCRYTDIDPISFMNRFEMYSEENRKKLIEYFQISTGMPIEVPKDFSGLPSTNPLMSCVIRYKDEREDEDIPNIWKLFDIALNGDMEESNDRNRFIEYFDKVISKPLASFNITMGLFKIRPDVFLNLDATNRNYLKKQFGMNIRKCPDGEQYLQIIVKVKEKIKKQGKKLMDFSYDAWMYKDKTKKQYWLYAPGENAYLWKECLDKNIMMIGWDEIGNLEQYNDYNEILMKLKDLYGKEKPTNDAWALEDFRNNIQVGDIIIVKKGVQKLIGYGEVASEYYFDDERREYKHIRSVNWLKKGEWNIRDIKGERQVAMKTLTNLTPYREYTKKLINLIDGEKNVNESKNPLPTVNVPNIKKYTKEDFAREVFFDDDEYNTIVNLLDRKKNIILQGAPGVGKTYMAKKLAYSIIEKEDESRVKFVQFHQSYSYEDFVEGYRPTENSYELENGVFYTFCKEAEKNPNEKYYFIIDEINRGNLSKIFGELLMLIENDKRGQKISLAYSKKKFSVPENLYIIGLMNTADRSLAMIDYALRRRFAFYKVKTVFENKQFKEYQNNLNNQKLNELISKVQLLNQEINEDLSLGEGFEIGHSYFCNYKNINDKDVEMIIKYEILPLLEEYWFDNTDKYNEWKEKLNGVLNG